MKRDFWAFLVAYGMIKQLKADFIGATAKRSIPAFVVQTNSFDISYANVFLVTSGYIWYFHNHNPIDYMLTINKWTN